MNNEGHITSQALVLSGGGPIGVGWHSGMTAAFVESGVDIGAADMFVGTSAGAIVGSQIALGRKPLDEIGRARRRSKPTVATRKPYPKTCSDW